MMRTIEFKSGVAKEISRLIDLRCLSGSDYRSQTRILKCFDRFLVEHSLSEPLITKDMVEQYMQSLSHLQHRGRYNHFSVIRQLCRNIAKTNPNSYIPGPMRCVSASHIFRPYIYSEQQIKDLLKATMSLPPSGSLRPYTYYTLFGLLYTAGIRINEAFSLTIKDFNAQRKLLYIAKGKFRKARLLPLHSSTSHMLNGYLKRRKQFSPRSKDAPFFINRLFNPLSHSPVYATFRQLLKTCHIPHHKHIGPRIHDLRHTFAVHRLLLWYREKKDVNAMLPFLSTYLGHVSICSTRIYLTPTARLFDQVGNRFHNYYTQNIKGKKS